MLYVIRYTLYESMKIIQFKKNQKEIWNKFIAENSSESFLQAWEWGEFQVGVGRKILRVGVVDNNFKENDKEVSSIKYQVSSGDLLATVLIIKYDLPFGQSYLYCPRGPVVKVSSIKYQVSSILNFLFNEIEKIGKKERAMFLKIDPPVEMNQESRIMNHEYPTNFKKSLNEIQPRNTLILDLTKSEEELLKEMKPKTRYNIRLAERKGVEVRYWKTPPSPPLSGGGRQKYFEKFWKLVEETSRRDKFASHNKNYYWKMLENCRERKFSFPALAAKLYLAEYKNKTIAANIILSFGDFCVYLHGASSNEYRNVMAPYLLQWRQILDAKKTGCKAYDFWGIDFSKSQIPNPKSQIPNKFKIQNSKFNDWSGITRFKKGFGGEEKNYIGAYDLVFDWKKYYLYKFFKKIKGL